MNELWNVFAQSGRVEDYLKYKEKETQELKDANYCQGLDNKGTDNRGE